MSEQADNAMRKIWREWLEFYTAHFRTAGVAISMADQAAFYEIAQPELHALVEAGFKLGFEHAVEGGEEFAKRVPALAGKAPLVLYFDNEEDRRGMMDAIAIAKPGMVEAKVPERRR